MKTEVPENGSAALVFRDGAIRAVIDLRVYRLTAVKKTAYRLADKVTAILGEPREHSLALELAFPPGTPEGDAQKVGRLFFQELLDQELREQIGAETSAIRSLIIAQAFSRTDLIKH